MRAWPGDEAIRRQTASISSRPSPGPGSGTSYPSASSNPAMAAWHSTALRMSAHARRGVSRLRGHCISSAAARMVSVAWDDRLTRIDWTMAAVAASTMSAEGPKRSQSSAMSPAEPVIHPRDGISPNTKSLNGPSTDSSRYWQRISSISSPSASAEASSPPSARSWGRTAATRTIGRPDGINWADRISLRAAFSKASGSPAEVRTTTG